MLTRRGWLTGLLAGACLVLGRVFGTVEGYVIGATLVALLVVAVAWLVVTRVDVSVTRLLHPPRVHAGSHTRVDLTVANQGRRLSPVLSLRDQVSQTKGASLLVGPLAPGEDARAAYRFATERRGVITVGPLVVELTDPFGLTRLRIPAAGVSELIVYPPIESLPTLPLSAGNDPLAGAVHPNSLGRAGEDFYALRAYVVGDDLRRVHWAATARHDELMVRQDEIPWQGRTTLVLDDRAGVHSPESFERMVSAAASILVAGAGRQDLVRIVTASGADSGFGAGRSHTEALLEALASITARNTPTLRGAGELLRTAGVSGGLVVLSGEPGTGEMEALAGAAATNGPEALLTFSPSPTGGPLVSGAVVRLGSDTGLGAGWAAALRSRRGGSRSTVGGSR